MLLCLSRNLLTLRIYIINWSKCQTKSNVHLSLYHVTLRHDTFPMLIILLEKKMNRRQNVSFYCLIKHWILHIAYFSLALWLKIFILLEFYDYTKLNLVGRQRKSLPHIKRLSAFFKLNLVLKTVAAFFSKGSNMSGKQGVFLFYKILVISSVEE